MTAVIDGWDGALWGRVGFDSGIPTARPYNVAQPLPTPIPAIYGPTNEAVHPTVVDFRLHGLTDWHGWRFWAAWTPYPDTNDDYENPCIYVSSDGMTWEEPAGVSNPLVYTPFDPTTHHSDPHLQYDPDTGTLWLMFRESGALNADPQRFVAFSSPDGVTWTRSDVPPVWGLEHAHQVCPVLVRAKRGDWWLWSVDGSLLVYRNGCGPLGPFSRHRTCVITNPPASGRIWHFDVQPDRGGRGFVGLFGYIGDYGVPGGWSTYPARSLDGIAWTLGLDVLPGRAGEWDQEPYRPCIQIHGSGARYRVWYSARSHTSGRLVWRIGYTEIPVAEWPAPPT